MSKKPTLYVAYGSNMNLPQMALRCPTAEVVATSELKDFELLFRGSRSSAVATVEPKEGSSVPVLLWKIREKDEASLDRYEGYPHFYDKQHVEVELDGKVVSAVVYIMTPGHEFGMPSTMPGSCLRSRGSQDCSPCSAWEDGSSKNNSRIIFRCGLLFGQMK